MGLTENQRQEITRFIQTHGWNATFDEGDILEDLLDKNMTEWLAENQAIIRFIKVQGYNRVEVRIPGYMTVERDTLHEAYETLRKYITNIRIQKYGEE